MDEPHLAAALRYLAHNPVSAGLATSPDDWDWSSVHAQLGRVGDDGLTATAPVCERWPDYAALIAADEDQPATERLLRAASIGRPLGRPEFIGQLEARAGRSLAPKRCGPKPKTGISALSP